jgi:hypothetical protein
MQWQVRHADGAERRVEPATPPPAIEARVILDTGWPFPLVNVREPVTYRLQIEYDPQVSLLPESIAPTALRRALVRTTALPPELLEIVEADKRTVQVAGERIQETVVFTLRFSKPGVYSVPALQVTYSLDKSRRTSQVLQSVPQQGYVLTVDAHMPAGAGALPGDILAPPRLLRRPWLWLRFLTIGLMTSGALILGVGLFLKMPRPQRTRRKKRPSPRQLRGQYQTELQQLRHRLPTTSGPLSLEARTWLRDCATLVRCLLGDWWSGDRTRFAGGAGVSAAMITAHLQMSTTEQETVLQPSLQLLQELDELAAALAPTLTPEDYQRISEAVQATILQLTHYEASRVFRAASRL